MTTVYDKYKRAFEGIEHEKELFGCEMREFFGNERYCSSAEGLVDLINYCSITKESKVVEVGSWYGGSTILFAETGADVTAIDPWSNEASDIKDHVKISSEAFQNVEGMFDRNLAKYKNVTKLKKRSLDAANDFEDHSIDVVYIDANHNYDDVIADLKAWIPKVKVGGWICGHDMCLDGVAAACVDFLPMYPKVFRDSSWAFKLAKELGFGLKVFIGTAMNFEYVAKAHAYLSSLDRIVNGDHIHKFCVTVGFDASEVMKKMYPTITFIKKPVDEIKWQNTNYCLQHGDFLNVLNANDRDLVIFTDADIVMQRSFSSLDYAYLASLDDDEICLAKNSGESDNLLREHIRLQQLAPKDFATPPVEVIEQKYGVNLGLVACYNTGVVACNYKTYKKMFEKYLEEIEFVDKAYGHYAKQQWLMCMIAHKYLNIVRMPAMIHTHGHAGTPRGIDFHKDVAFAPVDMFGSSGGQIEVLFRHHLEQPKRLIKLVYADDGGCVWYRLIMPHQWLKKKHPTLWEIDGDFKYTQAELQQASIVFVQRCQDVNHYFAMEGWKNPDTKIIWDGDDDYLRVDDNNRNGYGSMTPEAITGLMTWLKNVDAITVSTQYLKDYYKKVTKTKVPIHVMPNCIDFNVWDNHYHTRKEVAKNKDYVVIGWHGGCSHQSDFEEMAEWIMKLFKKYVGKIRFAVVGWNFTDLPQFDNAVFKRYVDYYDWTKDTVNFGRNLVMFDIGIAPLSKNVPFNLSKSNVKYLEFSSLGIPCVATDIEPYKDIKNGETGYLVDNSVDSWVDTLSMLIENPELRNRIGENARQYVRENFNQSIEAERRQKIYEEIMAGGKNVADAGCNNPAKK